MPQDPFALLQIIGAPGSITPAQAMLDGAAMAALDAFVLAAASHCSAGLAVLSLDNARGHCFTARSHRQLRETPQEAAILAQLFDAGEYTEAIDLAAGLAQDPVIVALPVWRFCAGVPIGVRGQGFRGILCVFDRQPRDLTAAQRATLADLATATTRLLTRIEADAHAAERERQFDELVKRQRRSQAAIDQSATGMALLSPEGVWLAVNPALCSLLGYNETELIGTSGIGLNPEHLRTEVSARMRQLSRGEINAYQREKPYIRKDGTLVWVLQTITMVRTQDGEPEFLVAEFMDITARRVAAVAAEAASRRLNDANRLMRMGEELAHVGHWRFELEGAKVFWSDEVYRIHGRAVAAGPPDLDSAIGYYHPEDRDKIASLAETALATGQGYTAELRIIRPGGEHRVIRTTGQCERDSDGEITGIFGVFQDVTDLRETERRLDTLNTRLLLATHAGQVGIMELSYPNRGLYFDSVMAQLFGLGSDSARLTAEDCWGAVHPDDVPLLTAVIDGCEQGSPGYELEYRVIWPNGDIRYIQSRGTLVVDAAGLPTKIVGTSWDVTEMRNLTAQLAAEKDRAERASHAKSNFLAVMSHEIRTPMNGVMGMNALLLDTTLTPVQRRMAEAVRYSADALLAIIDDILDLSKLEAGRVDLESIDFDLAELIDKVAEVMAPKATAKRLALSIERTFSGPCWFRGDPARLRQILLNLVSNAVKFTEAGRIVISASALPGDGRTSRLWFEVRDTGIGIADDAKRRLFQPFEQADASITRRFGGTGLGLSICKRLVEQMDGMIGVMDHARGGSVFWFEIALPTGTPRASEDAAAEDRATASPATPATGHILLAEDNAMNVKLAAWLLEAKGYTVEVARNGFEAVAAARRGGFDLILMDMQMPVLDGLAATRQIRSQDEYGRRVPIIAMTANAMKEDERRCVEAGMNDYISKPIVPERFDQLVRRWIAPRQASAAR